MQCYTAADRHTAYSSPTYFMAREAHDGRSRSFTTSPSSSGVWEPPGQMHLTDASPFPSWSAYTAGTFVGDVGEAGPAFAAHPWAVASAADSRLPSEHHAWSQNAAGTEAHGSGGGYGGDFLSLLEARSVTTPEVFEDVVPTACDYLTGVGAVVAASNMAGPCPPAYGLAGVDDYGKHTGGSGVSPVKPETAAASPLAYSWDRVAAHGSGMGGSTPCYDLEVKRDGQSQQQGFGAHMSAFLQQLIPSRVAVPSALDYSGLGTETFVEPSYGTKSSLSGAGSFSEYISNTEIMSSNGQKQEITRPEMASGTSGSGSASVTTKRKSEGRAGGNAKKSRKEVSRESPPKTQVPKLKLGEKITALQQIVSPFGKTDTASVLFETIKYIRFLHEQMQLFTEPYMAKSSYKGHIQFGVEEKAGTEGELRGRGLCLVPFSWTSQVYGRDDTLPDCWTPAYRSCLYR